MKMKKSHNIPLTQKHVSCMKNRITFCYAKKIKIILWDIINFKTNYVLHMVRIVEDIVFFLQYLYHICWNIIVFLHRMLVLNEAQSSNTLNFVFLKCNVLVLFRLFFLLQNFPSKIRTVVIYLIHSTAHSKNV